MIKLDIKGNENRGSNLVIEKNKGIYNMKTSNLANENIKEVREIKTNKSEVGVVNMSIQGNNALKIEKKTEERKSGFQFKINKFDIYIGITKNEEREAELNEKKIKSYQNLKAVQADREKMAVKFLGDL